MHPSEWDLGPEATDVTIFSSKFLFYLSVNKSRHLELPEDIGQFIIDKFYETHDLHDRLSFSEF